MKAILMTVLLALTAMTAKGQATEIRKVKDFKAIEASNGIEVIYTQGDIMEVMAESGIKGQMSAIVTEVKGKTLRIYIKEGIGNKAPGVQTARVYITHNAISSFKASTGASIKAKGKIIADNLAVKLTTGAAFTADIECGKVVIKTESGAGFRGLVKAGVFEGYSSGGSNIKITGVANEATVYCNGGTLLGGKFVCQKASVKAVNASSAYINSTGIISADTDTTSSISYFGSPETINLAHGCSTVKRDNFTFAMN